jgi:Ca2+-binding EF-hand superfamily protein
VGYAPGERSGTKMRPEKLLILGLIVGSALAGGVLVTSPARAEQTAIKALDTDNDGTLDLDEVTQAAQAVFDRLQKDQDDTLDRKEVGSRLSAKEFAAADPDKDATLTKDEYLALVQKLFKQADTDGDGKLEAKELRSKAGRALLRLIR